MNIIKAPSRAYFKATGDLSVFLAGSIEMGKAEDWQARVTDNLDGYCELIFNPRRDDWDSSWKQSITDFKFHEQVNWELEHITKADFVLFYFDPTTMSPISLLELGLTSNTPNRIIVICPEGYWRKGNIEVVCHRYGILLYTNLRDGVDKLVELLLLARK